jgi:hypothetical protein
MEGYVRKHPSKLADQSTASPQSSGLVEERRDLGGGTAVPGRETEEESVATKGLEDGRREREKIVKVSRMWEGWERSRWGVCCDMNISISIYTARATSQ